MQKQGPMPPHHFESNSVSMYSAVLIDRAITQRLCLFICSLIIRGIEAVRRKEWKRNNGRKRREKERAGVAMQNTNGRDILPLSITPLRKDKKKVCQSQRKLCIAHHIWTWIIATPSPDPG
jgi:hypothetical protein